MQVIPRGHRLDYAQLTHVFAHAGTGHRLIVQCNHAVAEAMQKHSKHCLTRLALILLYHVRTLLQPCNLTILPHTNLAEIKGVASFNLLDFIKLTY